MKENPKMSGWETFFFVVGVLLIILSVFALVFLNPGSFVGILFTALLFLAGSKFCRCVDAMLENQRRIIIMLDNLRE